MNVNETTKATDTRLHDKLIALTLVFLSNLFDSHMALRVSLRTSKLVQTALTDSDLASHLVTDKFLSFSAFSTFFVAVSNSSDLKSCMCYVTRE